MQRPPEVDRGVSETQRRASYLIQGLPVGFWQVLRLVVSHGPLSHHLGVSKGGFRIPGATLVLRGSSPPISKAEEDDNHLEPLNFGFPRRNSQRIFFSRLVSNSVSFGVGSELLVLLAQPLKCQD